MSTSVLMAAPEVLIVEVKFGRRRGLRPGDFIVHGFQALSNCRRSSTVSGKEVLKMVLLRSSEVDNSLTVA